MAGIIFNIQKSAENSAFNVLQEPIKMMLQNETEAFEKDSIIKKVYLVESMDTFQEEYRSTTAMDGFKPTEDMEVAGISDFEESYNAIFRTQTWTNSFVVSKQTIEDNQMATISPAALGFIKGYGRTRERYAVAMLGAALGTVTEFEGKPVVGKSYDTTDGTLAGAKQQYFHGQHKPAGYSSTSGDPRNFTQANRFYAVDGDGSTALDFSGEDKEISEKVLDILGQVEAIMGKYKDDKGNITPVNPVRIIMGADYRLQDVLIRGLKSKYGSQMAGNGINTQFGKWEIVTSPYLSAVGGFADTDHAVILLDPERNREGKGAVWKERLPLTIRSYVDDRTEANVWAGRARFGVNFADWKPMAYINLAKSSGYNTNSAVKLTAPKTSVYLTKSAS